MHLKYTKGRAIRNHGTGLPDRWDELIFYLTPIHFLLNGTGISSHCLLEIRGNNKESLHYQLGVNAKEINPEENLCKAGDNQGDI